MNMPEFTFSLSPRISSVPISPAAPRGSGNVGMTVLAHQVITAVLTRENGAEAANPRSTESQHLAGVMLGGDGCPRRSPLVRLPFATGQ